MSSSENGNTIDGEATKLLAGSKKMEDFLEKVRKIGVGKVVTGCLSVILFMVMTSIKSAEIFHEMRKIMYMAIAGSLLMIGNGCLTIYLAKKPTQKKAVVVFVLGIISLIYEIIVMGLLIAFLTHHRNVFKDKNGKKVVYGVVLAVGWVVLGALKMIHGAILVYYGIKKNIIQDALPRNWGKSTK